MKTVQQIMQETGAKANIRNFRYMQENYTYKQKIRHAENVARSYQDKCSEMGLNCHVSVGGLDSITLHYFLEMCGVHVPCVSCSSLEQKGVQAVHKQIAAEMENTYSAREWLGAHMALPQDEIDTITDPDTRAQEQALHDACPPVPRMYFLKPLKPKTKVIEELGWPVLSKEIAGKICHTACTDYVEYRKVCNQIQTAREAERRIDAADSERGDKIRKDVRKNGLYNQRKGRKR